MITIPFHLRWHRHIPYIGNFLRGLILANFANPSRKRKIKNSKNFILKKIGCGFVKIACDFENRHGVVQVPPKITLPNPNGPLSHHVPPSTIAAANKEVKPLLAKTPHGERGKYYVYTEEETFLVADFLKDMISSDTRVVNELPFFTHGCHCEFITRTITR